MSKKLDLSKINWLQIISTVIGILIFLLGGGFLYNEVLKSKVLTYTVLPNYNVGGQSFSGLVIENRGRVPLTDVQIIMRNLEAPIGDFDHPGLHEPIQIASGGKGQTELLIKMPRFSSGAPPLPIYIVTTDTITLQEGKTFFVSSKEAAGTPGKGETTLAMVVTISGIFTIGFVFYMMWGKNKYWRQYEERDRQKWERLTERFVELFEEYAEGLISFQEAVKQLRKAGDDHESN